MPTILLHVQKTTRRDALARVIGKDYEVVHTGESSAQDWQEDLLILDNLTLQRIGLKALSQYKKQNPHPQSPILLVLPGAKTADLEPDVWKRIDDIANIPVRWREMKSRIQVLTRMQKLAREKKSAQDRVSKYITTMLDNKQSQADEFEDFFESITCGRIVLRGQEIVEANLKARQLIGVEGLVGCTIGDLSPPEQPGGQRSGKRFRDLLRVGRGEATQAEWAFMGPENTTSIFRLVISPLRFEDEDCAQVLFRNR